MFLLSQLRQQLQSETVGVRVPEQIVNFHWLIETRDNSRLGSSDVDWSMDIFIHCCGLKNPDLSER